MQSTSDKPIVEILRISNARSWPVIPANGLVVYENFPEANKYDEFYLNDHLYRTVYLPTMTRASVNDGKWTEYSWLGLSAGFLPAQYHAKIITLRPNEVTMIRLHPVWFSNVAHETIDVDHVDLQFVAGISSPIGSTIARTMKYLASLRQPHEWPLLAESLATAIAARTLIYMAEIAGAPARTGNDPFLDARIKRVIDFIEGNINRPIHLSEMADIGALSHYHFARSFRKLVGISPMRYVWKRRVEHAKIMLRQRFPSLMSIAHDCGFASQSHFTTVFKRETGMTPLLYRMQL